MVLVSGREKGPGEQQTEEGMTDPYLRSDPEPYVSQPTTGVERPHMYRFETY